MAQLLAPVGEFTSLGIGKETTPGQAAVPTLFHTYTQFNPTPKNTAVARTGARKRLGQSYPGTGSFIDGATLDVEPTLDTLGQLLAFALGNQAAPSQTLVNTTVKTATTAGSNTVIAVSGGTGMVNIFVGCKLLVDTSTNMETVTVLSVTGTSFTATTTKAHAQGVTIVNPTGGTAYSSLLKMGTPLPSFTVEHAVYNQGAAGSTFARDYVGCKVETLSLAMNNKGGLAPKFTLAAMSELIQASPATPSFSTLGIPTFENPQALAIYKAAVIGQSGEVSVLNWDITLANNLNKDYFSYGAGRIVGSFPEQQRKVSAKMTLGFESNAQYQDFIGQANGGPAATIPGVSLQLVVAGADMADPTNGFPYALWITLPNLFIPQLQTPGKSTGVLEQTIEFDAAESAPGAGDDITIQLLNTATTAY
ncbi:hypothetical protein EPN42_01425 [bacterium]|nr:MAG: hypothetical protein EPN42_01425 [bacterium]